MVPTVGSDASRLPTASPQVEIPSVSPIRPSSSSSLVGVPPPDGMASIRRRFETAGFSPEVVQILLSSWGRINPEEVCRTLESLGRVVHNSWMVSPFSTCDGSTVLSDHVVEGAKFRVPDHRRVLMLSVDLFVSVATVFQNGISLALSGLLHAVCLFQLFLHGSYRIMY